MTEERLHKVMARAGVGSRRACEEIIRQGRVLVDGRLAKLGDVADPEHNSILVDGAPLPRPARPIVIALYKPAHVLSTDAPHAGDARPTARSLIPLDIRLFAIGRLDAESEGLILFTNDGDLAQRLAHPRYEHEKVYRVQVGGRPDGEALRQWRRGLELEDGKTAPALVTFLLAERNTAWLRVTLREGRKRQIRRVAAALGHPVKKLIREQIGPIKLGRLKPGEWRRLTEDELRTLRPVVHAARSPRS